VAKSLKKQGLIFYDRKVLKQMSLYAKYFVSMICIECGGNLPSKHPYIYDSWFEQETCQFRAIICPL
jgi:hypothetical protein